jgi:hypothetical protein
MAELLACRRGKVAVMEGCEGIPGQILLDGFEPVASIITSPEVLQRVNVQFQTSLKESVYVYVFGDQMGNVVISGIAFAGLCEGEESGIEDIFKYYRDYRASQRKETVTVTFGKQSISGFLTESRMSSRDPDNLTLNYTFTINTLPKKASS